MPVVYSAAIKGTRMQDVIDAIDGGSGPGKLQIGTVGMAVVVATEELGDPSFSRTGSIISLLDTPLVVACENSGTAAAARLSDSNDVVCVSGLKFGLVTDIPVPDIILDRVTATAGQSLRINSGSLTHG